MITTIQVDQKTKEKLDNLKLYARESYNDILERLVAECKGKKIDEGSLKETIEILSDSGTLKDIAEALDEFSKGKFTELK